MMSLLSIVHKLLQMHMIKLHFSLMKSSKHHQQVGGRDGWRITAFAAPRGRQTSGIAHSAALQLRRMVAATTCIAGNAGKILAGMRRSELPLAIIVIVG